MKKRFLLATTVLYLLPLFTFSQIIEWQNTIGGTNNDLFYSIKQTADGGYILGGYSNSGISGDKTENSNGVDDYWIVKTDDSGAIQWQNTIGGSGSDYLFSIEQTIDGGYILGGYSNSGVSGDKTEICLGNFDFWMVKVDAAGNIQWQNTIGGNDDDHLLSIKQTSDGGYILGGSSTSNISGDKTENCLGAGDYWIIKTDASGVIQWQNTIGGTVDDVLYSIQETSDGGYILGGTSTSSISGDKTENSNGGVDYWVVKTDSSGTIQWQNTIGGNNTDYLYSTQETADGGYILGGNTDSGISGDKTESSNGGDDYWIVKIDVSGVIQWQNTIGGGGEDYLHSIEQTVDAGYLLGGSSYSNISGDKSENSNGSQDYWIVKTDPSGVIQWQKTIGGSDHDIFYSNEQTSDGGYILGGYSQSNISGDKTETCLGNFDFWIVKITDQYNSITGKLFIDANSNNVQDAGELSLVNKQITEINTNRFSFSGQTGNYNVSVLDSGTFTVSPTILNYYNIVPVTHNATFTGLQQTDSLNDFAFQPTGVINDLCVSLTPLGPFRPGFTSYYQITYENLGTTTLNPTIIFFQDYDLSFVSSSPVANSVTSDSVIWNFGPLEPFQQGSILVTVEVFTVTPISSVINSSVRIEPIAGDANTLCNESYWETFTTGSSDPNDILVNEDTLLTTQFPNPPYLEYIIRFQNTGNDTAFTVNILNKLDTTKLDLSTFEYVTSSQPVDLTWIPSEKNMEFHFENILLPDSNMNEPASHGFVRYRIKPKSNLTVGDSINNSAAIYFDFNAPVNTNNAITSVVSLTSLSETISPSNNLLLYPNPANSTLTIEIGILQNSECRINITDVSGRIIFSKSITTTSSKHNIDLSSFSQGIYFVELQAGDKISRGRFVRE